MMSYATQARNRELELEAIRNRIEELETEWWEKLGHCVHYDAYGTEWFEMTPEEEELDRGITSEHESLEILLEELEVA